MEFKTENEWRSSLRAGCTDGPGLRCGLPRSCLAKPSSPDPASPSDAGTLPEEPQANHSANMLLNNLSLGSPFTRGYYSRRLRNLALFHGDVIDTKLDCSSLSIDGSPVVPAFKQSSPSQRSSSENPSDRSFWLPAAECAAVVHTPFPIASQRSRWLYLAL